MKKFRVVLLLLLVAAGCEEDEVPSGCDLGSVSYSAGIRQVIQVNCATEPGCHNATRGDGNNFDFTTYDGIKEGIGSFYDRINRPVDDPLYMPKDGRMDPCALYQLNVWLLNGAPEN